MPRKPTPGPPALLTVAQVAEAVGVSVQRVRAMIGADQLPAVRYGAEPRGVWMVTRADLDALLATERPAGRPKKKGA